MLKLGVSFFSKLPLTILYSLSRLFFALNYYVIRYRREVVKRNLENAFPEKSVADRARIEKAFYRQFFQVWSETLKSKRYRKSDWNRRVQVKGIEMLNGHLMNEQSAILLSGHTANWEWSGSAISQALIGQMTVFFKPVKNGSFGEEIHAIREQHGIKAVPKDNALRYLIKTRKTPQVIGMIGDQIPAIGTEKYWLKFLNQETAFYQGAEKFAVSMKYPVYYSKMRKLKPGYYEIEILPIYDGTSEISNGQIIKKYVQLLEQTIKENPSDYLWSHKRWKYTKEQASEATGKPYLFIS